MLLNATFNVPIILRILLVKRRQKDISLEEIFVYSIIIIMFLP